MTDLKRKAGRLLDFTASNETEDARLTIHSTLAAFTTQPSTEGVTKALLALQTFYGIPESDFKKAKVANPSFSSATWAQVSEQFGLEKFRDIPEEPFAKLLLPPSVHEYIMHTAAKWVSVYDEPYRHTREAARVRILDAWLVPLCAIFQGRLINKPESRVPPAIQFTKGGEVEFDVFVMSGGRNEGFLLLVVEMELSELNEDNVAQVLLGLSSGYQLNLEQTICQPVYALLTDLKSYYFFSFDGTRFTRSAAGNIRVNRTRKEFFVDMAELSERLFGALLKGYIGFLQQVAAKSKVRGELGDILKSLDLWDDAIKKAEYAKELLETKNRTRDAAERDGCEGLSLLRESALNLPESTFHFSADLGEGLKGEVDSALAEIFPAAG